MKRAKRKISWVILLGLLAVSLLAYTPGWTADQDSQRLSAPPSAWIYFPLIFNKFLDPTPAQKTAVLGAGLLLLESDEGS
jgi:hypothetical protein